ncbi:unnamed protein product [Cunninghamella blakesleeana]
MMIQEVKINDVIRISYERITANKCRMKIHKNGISCIVYKSFTFWVELLTEDEFKMVIDYLPDGIDGNEVDVVAKKWIYFNYPIRSYLFILQLPTINNYFFYYKIAKINDKISIVYERINDNKCRIKITKYENGYAVRKGFSFRIGLLTEDDFNKVIDFLPENMTGDGNVDIVAEEWIYIKYPIAEDIEGFFK